MEKSCCAGQNVRSGFEDVYIRPLVLLSGVQHAEHGIRARFRCLLLACT